MNLKKRQLLDLILATKEDKRKLTEWKRARTKDKVFERYVSHITEGSFSFRVIALPSDTNMNEFMNGLGRRHLSYFRAQDYKYFWFRTDSQIILAFAASKPSCTFFDRFLELAVGCNYITSYNALIKRASAERLRAVLLKHWATRSPIQKGSRAHGGTHLPK
ncbi:hypothetical protein [Pseudomonas hunanensis]|uniref:hypothetical protein n=1 Tax=Pseudomonas hunanensis TaxID=1247546 RepID=UPI0015B8E6D9|nr:hypothetical protein [Pseudomonas hunanensis]